MMPDFRLHSVLRGDIETDMVGSYPNLFNMVEKCAVIGSENFF